MHKKRLLPLLLILFAIIIIIGVAVVLLYHPSTTSNSSQTSNLATFTEVGLPTSTPWALSYNGLLISSNNTKISLNSSVLSSFVVYNVSIGGLLYTANVTITNPDPSVLVNFTRSNEVLSQKTTFSESGLPSGTVWSVIYNGVMSSSNSTSMVVRGSTGSYQFFAMPAFVGGVNFFPAPQSGSLQAGSSQLITFANQGSDLTTTFTESGLPSGATWTVVYNGATQSSVYEILFSDAAGTYAFTVGSVQVSSAVYAPNPSSGQLAAGLLEAVVFSQSTAQQNLTTTFTESGLPSEYGWSVTYAGLERSSSVLTSSISFVTASGSFSYSVSALSNSSAGCSTTYTPSPSSGLLAAGSSQLIRFSSSMSCTTTFTESGLPTMNSWSVVYNGTTKSAKAPSSITFTSANVATYSYSVSSSPVVSGSCTTSYSASPSSGTLASGSTQAITFTSSVSCSSSGGGSSPSSEVTKFTESGLPAYSSMGAGNFTNNELIGNLSVSAAPGFDLYLCAGGAGNGPVNFNGTYDVRSTGDFSFLGHQTSNTCYENTSYYDGDLAEAIIGIDATGPYTFVYNSSVRNDTLDYTLNSTSDVVIMIAAGNFGINPSYFSFPSGCTLEVGTGGEDAYENASVIVCPEQAPGTYSVNASLYGSYGGLLIGAYIFEAGTLAQGGSNSTRWNVTYNGVTQSAQALSNITFTTTAGDFAYSVETLSKTIGSCTTTYTPNPASGYLTAGSLQQIDFTPSTHCITTTFRESGLPSGLTWSVTDNGNTLSNASPSSISFVASGLNHYNVSNVTIQSVENISIGEDSEPFGVAYDPENGDMYVTDAGSGDVSVINQSNDVVENISLGPSSEPYSIEYDPANGDMYVTDSYYYFESYGNVTIINSANAVIKNIFLGETSIPFGLAYDPANGDMYVTNWGYGDVSVINQSNEIIENISLGVDSGPYTIAYDPANGDMYTADWFYGDVSVINQSNDVAAELSIGIDSLPYGVAYDPANGDMYISDADYGELNVIDSSTNSIIANISLGPDSEPFGIAYNPANEDIYVTDLEQGDVHLINSSTNEVKSSISLGPDSYPYGIAYDPVNGDMYATDWIYGDVSVISPLPTVYLPYPSSGTVSAGANVSINYMMELTVPSSSASVDVGGYVALHVTPSGGSGDYTYEWYSGSSCTGTPTSDLQSPTVGPLNTLGQHEYCVRVTDSLSDTVTAIETVTVNSLPTLGSLTPSASRIDSGETVELTGTISGGTEPYTVASISGYLEDGTLNPSTYSCTILSQTLRCYITSSADLSGSEIYTVVIRDADSNIASNAGALAVTKFTTPSIAVAENSTIDLEQTEIITASNATGGVGPITYQLFVNSSDTPFTLSNTQDCSASLSGTVTCHDSPVTEGHYWYIIQSTDTGIGYSVNTSASEMVTVNTALNAYVPGLSTPDTPIDVGTSINVWMSNFTALDGTPPYSYQWFESFNAGAYTDATDCVDGSATTSNCTFSPSTTGYYSFKLQITDALGESINTSVSAPLIEVNSELGSPSIEYQPKTPIDVGQQESVVVDISSVLGTGTGPVTYTLLVNNSADTYTSTGITCTVIYETDNLVCKDSSLAVGAYTFEVAATDSAASPETTTTGPFYLKEYRAVIVNSTFTGVTLEGNATTVDGGQLVNFTATVSGGSAPYSYQWKLYNDYPNYYSNSTFTEEDGCSSTSSWCVVFAPDVSVTTYFSRAVSLRVTDGAGNRESADGSVTVNPALNAYVPGLSTPETPIDVGTAIGIWMSNFTVLDGTPPYSYQWFESVNSSAYTDATDCVGGSATTSNCTFSPSTAGYYNFTLQVTDSLGQSINVSAPSYEGTLVSVNSELGSPSIKYQPKTPIDVGQQESLVAYLPSVLGTGTSPYSYSLLVNDSGNYVALLDATCYVYDTDYVACRYPTSFTGAFTYEINVTDSASLPETTTTGPSSVVIVNSTFTGVTLEGNATTVDGGQLVNFTATVSGGSAPYSYQWKLYNDYPNYYSNSTFTEEDGCSSTSSWCVVFAPDVSVTTYFSRAVSLRVTDGAGNRESADGSVTVNKDPMVSLSSNVSDVDPGQLINLTVVISGGSGVYPTISWSGDYEGQLSSADSDCLTSESSPGTYHCTIYAPYTESGVGDTYTVSVTDSLGYTTDSYAYVTVNSPPEVYVYSNVSTVDANQAVQFTADAFDGSGGFTYSWLVQTDNGFAQISGCSSSDDTCTINASTNNLEGNSFEAVFVTVTDSLGEQASNPGYVWVNPKFSASLSASLPTIDNGSSSVLTATASGGSGDYTYTFYDTLGDPISSCDVASTEATGVTCEVAPISDDTYTVIVSDGLEALLPTTTITVYPALVRPTLSPRTETLYEGGSATAITPTDGSLDTSTNPGLTYEWYTGNNVCGDLSSLDITSTTYTPSTSNSGTTYYCAFATDGTGAVSLVSTTPTTVTVLS